MSAEYNTHERFGEILICVQANVTALFKIQLY